MSRILCKSLFPLWILHLCLFAGAARASSSSLEHPIFQRLTTENGLPQNAVFAILQDHYGYMWFGTQDGLCRYDGYTFLQFRTNEEDSATIPGNKINTLFEDRSGTMWVGTNDGLARYDAGRKKFTRLSIGAQRQSVGAIAEDAGGTLWIGTKQGLFSYDRASGAFTFARLDSLYPPDINDRMISVLRMEGDSTLWIGGRILLRRQMATGAFSRCSPHPSDAGRIAMYEEFKSIVSDTATHEMFFISLGGGLYKLDASRTVIKMAEKMEAQALIRDARGGGFWVGSGGGGLAHLDRTLKITREFPHHDFDDQSLAHDVVLSLCIDNTGVLWVGTFGGGVSKLQLRSNAFTLYRMVPGEDQSLSMRSIRTICKDTEGKLLIGGYDGLDVINKERTRITHFDLRRFMPWGINPYTIVEDPRSPGRSFWVGFEGMGLKKIDVVANTVGAYPAMTGRTDVNPPRGEFVNTLMFDAAGVLWIGTWDGLISLNPARDRFTHYLHDPGKSESIRPFPVTVFFDDHDGTLWIGTGGGGFELFDRTTGRFRRFAPHSPAAAILGQRTIKCVHEDTRGALWVGTDQGLFRIDRGRTAVTLYTTRDGLPNEVIYGIAEDRSGNLWMSSNRGIFRFSPDTKALRAYTPADGLQSYEFNTNAYFHSADGEMFFGGINGFNAFYPDSIRDSAVPAPTIVTNFRVFNRERILAEDIAGITHIDLSHEEGVLSFDFAVLDYARPAGNQFMCMMEGLDNGWNFLGNNNTVTYANMRPGNYVLKVRGRNSENAWSAAPATITLRIAPPFWETWWFRSIIGVVIVAIGPLVYYRRVTELKKQKVLKDKFSRRLLEHQEQERKRIAGELHDSLGQNLLVLKNQAVLGMRSAGDAVKTKDLLTRISDLTSETLKDTRRISHNLHPYQLERLGLTQALLSMLENVKGASNISFTAAVEPLEFVFSKEAEIVVYRILQEALNNMMKHSQATEAHVSVTRHPLRVHLDVRDNGRGFTFSKDPSQQGELGGGIGLQNITERVNILKGTIEIASAPGRGTHIHIEIPVSKTGGERDLSHG